MHLRAFALPLGGIGADRRHPRLSRSVMLEALLRQLAELLDVGLEDPVPTAAVAAELTGFCSGMTDLSVVAAAVGERGARP